MATVINTPLTVTTLSYTCFITNTIYIVQPNTPSSCSIRCMSFGNGTETKILIEFLRRFYILKLAVICWWQYDNGWWQYDNGLEIVETANNKFKLNQQNYLFFSKIFFL